MWFLQGRDVPLEKPPLPVKAVPREEHVCELSAANTPRDWENMHAYLEGGTLVASQPLLEQGCLSMEVEIYLLSLKYTHRPHRVRVENTGHKANLKKTCIPQHNKSYISQTHSKHYPKWWKIESISPEIRNKTRVPTLTTTIQHSVGSFGHSNQSRKRNKSNADWKTRSKTLTVCRWYDALHRKP